MKRIARIHPFCWFLTGWFIFAGWNYFRQWAWWYTSGMIHIDEKLPAGQASALVPCLNYLGISSTKDALCTISANVSTFSLFFTMLLTVHLAIYWLLLLSKFPNPLQWIVLLMQGGLGCVIVQFLRNTQISGLLEYWAVFLSLMVAFILVCIVVFKQLLPILLSVSCYLLGLLLYLHVFRAGSLTMLNYLWNKDTSYTVAALFLLTSLVFYMQLQQVHERTRSLLADLDRAHAQVSAYALRVEALTALAERQRLARDLHDTLSQGLAGLVMQLDAATSYFVKDQPASAQNVVTLAMTRARTMLTETRYVIQDLRHGRSPRSDDLPELVQEEVERFGSATGLVCEADLSALASLLPEHCEHILRVISECLTNIARHARAQHVWIQAQSTLQSVFIVIRDDGCGFDPAPSAVVPGHYGLLGLRERVRLISGQLEILSAPDRGTTVQIHIPTQQVKDSLHA